MATSRLTWVGHGTFLLEAASGARVLIDAFVDNCPTTPDELKGGGLGHLDAILVTHAHLDHVADLIPHQQRTGAKVFGIVELTGFYEAKGAIDADALVGFNKGGTTDVAPGVRVTMVDAKHSSSFKNGEYAGEPAGYVIELEGGFTLYHAGDTTVFGDMALIGELYAPDLAVLPIGDFYTMGPKEAAKAVELTGVRQVVGGHWGTFPPLVGRPAALADLVADGVTVHQLEPGGSIDLTR